MNYSQSTYHSNIYREFRAIDLSEWRTVIRFYDLYQDKLDGLEFDESFDITLAYTSALFEIGDHENHLKAADNVLEMSVMNNVKFFNGEDVFQKTLFKKAASNFSLHQLENCDYILREMLRIDPYHQDGALFLKKCLRTMRSELLKKSRAFSVLLLIISAVMICLEWLVVESFYPEYIEQAALVRTCVLALSFFILVGGEVYHRLRCSWEVEHFVGHLKKRKNK